MTRYERVQEILDRAAGSSAADYGGRGRFWHLPLPQLFEVVIHGVRMIAPAREVKAACCHGESVEAGELHSRAIQAAAAPRAWCAGCAVSLRSTARSSHACRGAGR
jgi:hypothetical protein